MKKVCPICVCALLLLSACGFGGVRLCFTASDAATEYFDTLFE